MSKHVRSAWIALVAMAKYLNLGWTAQATVAERTNH
jgi:hypothetical protein